MRLGLNFESKIPLNPLNGNAACGHYHKLDNIIIMADTQKKVGACLQLKGRGLCLSLAGPDAYANPIFTTWWELQNQDFL